MRWAGNVARMEEGSSECVRFYHATVGGWDGRGMWHVWRRVAVGVFVFITPLYLLIAREGLSGLYRKRLKKDPAIYV
jgi:hypothetical protein